jgi:YegS/Rv2252/BmrU family lipid kinase
MADVLIFANPIAGKGRGRKIAADLVARLTVDGFAPQAVLQRCDQFAFEKLGIPRAVIAIGGDGTIRQVAAAVLRAYPNDPPPLLIVPMGTANLLGRHLNIAWSSETLVTEVSAALQAGHKVKLDAAAANNELFLLIAGIGMDARIVHELDRIRSGPIDYTSYVLPAALALGLYTFPPLTVTVDGRPISADIPSLAFVGNVKEYGTGFPILPHARPDDGLLDVCVLACANRRQAMRLLLQAAAGEHLQAEGTIYTKGREICIESPAPVPVQIDGDAAGHTPLEIHVLPTRLSFIVPAP